MCNYFIKNCKLREMERIFHYKTTNGHSLTGNEDLFNKGMSYLPVVKKIFGLQ